MQTDKQSSCHTFFRFVSSCCGTSPQARRAQLGVDSRVPACVCRSESSAGVGDGDDGGAQSKQGGQEMGDQSCPGTQEHHPLQESETTAEPNLWKSAALFQIEWRVFSFIFSPVSGGVRQPRLTAQRAGATGPGVEDRGHQRKHSQGRGASSSEQQNIFTLPGGCAWALPAAAEFSPSFSFIIPCWNK